ncbi:hypothetical protein COO60DRAFT_1702966 [Scenedesmus sp. NREL 46B-D3]|nr:hypothetical protein COO60DRAFT_1702966 [Scenedesmus sp. NREL 46B-D3]
MSVNKKSAADVNTSSGPAAAAAAAAGIKGRAHLSADEVQAQQQGSTQQQQQQQKQAEAGVEAAALQLLKGKLNLSFPITHPEQLLAGPKHAKCLKNVLLHPPRAAVYGSEALSHGCVKEVLGFYADLAADSAKDFQLVAACAEDIVTHCPSAPAARLFTCLVQHKHLVKQYCSAALGARLAASAGLFRWDQDLAASCGVDADDWCADEQASEARLPSLGGFTLGCLRQGTLGPCRRSWRGALFRRQMAESEDVRFSFDLSRGCSQELALHCGQAQPGSGEAALCLERQLQADQLGEDCGTAVLNMQLMRAADGRLDWRLRQLCRGDVARLCREAQYVGGLDPSLMLDDWAAPATAGERLVGVRGVAVPAAAGERTEPLVCIDGWNAGQLTVRRTAKQNAGGLLRKSASVELHGCGLQRVNVTMCLRRKWQAISSAPCRAHVRQLAAQAFANALLDAPLLRGCAADVSRHCMEAGGALGCLKGLLANGLALAPSCGDVLQERLLEAADNFDLLPDVGRACKTERRLFCEGVPPDHGAVLDCLADFRDDPRFGDECRDALTSQFMLAVGDIRLLTALHNGCAADAAQLCPDVQPGSGRVIGCLQQRSSAVRSSSCRRQLMRLQGFAAHDYRLDFHLRQACSADVAKHCMHVVPGNGRIHMCLRQNDGKLSQQCEQQVETAEAREHQDVSLNPVIRDGSITQLIPCLKTHMGGASFAPPCKEALTAALARKGLKYSLQPELRLACSADVTRLCAGTRQAADAGGAAAAAAAAAAKLRRRRTLQQTTGAAAASAAAEGSASSGGGGDGGDGELLCLSQHLQELSPGCRQEAAAEVHRELLVYLPGMPLTAACDGDARQMCGAGSVEVSAMLQPGSLLTCLADRPEKLSPGCWAVMSLFDNEQLKATNRLATGPGAGVGNAVQLPGPGAAASHHQRQQQDVETSVLERVSQQVQSRLQGRLDDQLSTQLERYVRSLQRSAESSGFLWGVLASVSLTAAAAGCLAVVRLRGRRGSRRAVRGPGGSLVVKDGNV